jgi:hypothetical protein
MICIVYARLSSYNLAPNNGKEISLSTMLFFSPFHTSGHGPVFAGLSHSDERDGS